MQPGPVTYQTVPGAAQPVIAGAVTYEGGAQLAGGGAAQEQHIVAPTYFTQQAQPSVPSFVAAPGSVTYGLPATQASVPQQGSITYAHSGMVAGAGVVQMQGYPAEPGAALMNSPSMVAYSGSTAPAVMEQGQPGSVSMQHP